LDIVSLPLNKAIITDAYGQVFEINLGNAEYRLLHAEHEDCIRSIRLSHNKQLVITGSQNCTCRIYDLNSNKLILEDQTANLIIPAIDIDANGVICLVTTDEEIITISPDASILDTQDI
jgi:WD40 repeat protein